MPGFYPIGRCYPLQKALAFNSTAMSFPFQPLLPRLEEPGTQTLNDGVASLGCLEGDVKSGNVNDTETPNQLFIQPYAEGIVGTSFYMNFWGFSPLISVQAGSSSTQAWVPFFICQMWGLTGEAPGPGPRSVLADSERMCNRLAITMGTLGGGYICNPTLGGNIAAWARINLQGAKKWLVEFAADPNNLADPRMSVPGMNLLWRPI